MLSLNGIASALKWCIEEADAALADLSILADIHARRDTQLSAWMEEAGLCLRFLTAILESTIDPEFITVGGSCRLRSSQPWSSGPTHCTAP
ncbi:hypothetical protein [Pararhizobium sp. PWRC1-1]|uniref:hypothetical protein n=1 Tax=Pararhizobium sp. PWRC1-1 TaxID=2804566 RepID=UPI003CEC93CE